jgi:hypothetical protein
MPEPRTVGRARGARAGDCRLAGWIATRIDPAMAQAECQPWPRCASGCPAPLLADLAGAAAPFPREALRPRGVTGETC